jgi:starch synthase
MSLSVLSVASEAVPLIKTGGLADVAGALPEAVAPHGVAMTTMLPGYPSVMKSMGRANAVHHYDALLGEPARLLAGKISGQPLLVLDAPGFFARDGGPYGDTSGKDWPDNGRRFAALSRAAADVAGGIVKGKRFDLLHAHDWQAAMAPAYLRLAPAGKQSVPSVMTIHNMAFQGNFAPELFQALGLPKAAWSMNGVEYHGGVGFLKAGLEAASAITTVSPSYAEEIRLAEFGMGLEGLISSRGDRVSGIVNGIDMAVWDPATDPALAQTFTARTLAKRAGNKRALEKLFGLDSEDGPLFTVITRLTWQKGMDVLIEVLDHLVGIGGRLALLGSGDAALEAAFHAAATRHPGRIGIRTGYDEALSHLMQGGGDAILVPSRFEPCGLTQLYGLRYGCVPVVARTGGLADTVVDANLAALAGGVATGIQFTGVHYQGLAGAINRAVTLYRQPATWQAIQRNGMKADFSWARSGKAYADLYASLIADTLRPSPTK